MFSILLVRRGYKKSIHKLLKKKFKKDQGLAEQGLKLLDPAAGTLTFVIRALGRALLHGSSRIGEKTPEDGKDENVFDIRQGVAIAIYVKLDKPLKEKKVYYADLWGLRIDRYKYLLDNDVTSTDWQELEPKEPYYFFVPKDFALQEGHEKFWKATEIFKEWSSGINTHRDHFVVGFGREEIAQRLEIFTGNLSDEWVKKELKLRNTGSWELEEAREKVKGKKLEEKIFPYAYRPFDNRWIYFKKFELWECFMFLDKILIFALPSTLSVRVTGYQ
ncbi:MAG: hypothetical protein QMD80_09250 [archaeon]|nr:hypothetical protein [archaeon]MDI6886786.1 hypothetical protein [archaeon]